MAIRCSFCNIGMIHKNSIQPEKVFEDQAEGIVCYRDEKGELVCEGYDEGPRFSQQTPNKIYHRRHVELHTAASSLQQRWQQILEEKN